MALPQDNTWLYVGEKTRESVLVDPLLERAQAV